MKELCRFCKDLTTREMLLWTVAFFLGIVTGNLDHLISFYVVGSLAAVFILLRYVAPKK